jgi:purine nucleosidase
MQYTLCYNIHIKNFKIFITDPGVDDAIAILIASAREKEIAFVATFGNGPTKTTYQNLNTLKKWITKNTNISLPIYIGTDHILDAERPFTGEDVQFIHGKNLLEGITSSNENGIPSSHLYNDIATKNQPVDILSLGAVTELAMILKTKSIIPHIKSITVMGGTFYNQGNVAPRVEANFSHDPKALRYVVQSAEIHQIPLMIVPLDLTEKEELELTSNRLEELTGGLEQNTADLLHKLVGKNSTYPNFYRGKRGVYHFTNPLKEHHFKSCPIHDLTSYMVLIHPELFTTVTRPVITGQDGSIAIPTSWMEKGIECSIALEIKDPKSYWKLIKKYLTALSR